MDDAFKMPPIAAVMVTFNPTSSVVKCISAIVEQVAELVIVDNGSEPAVINEINMLINKRRNISLILLGDNFGIAHALNVGCRMLLEKSYRWCVTFDQDSQPFNEMVVELYKTWHSFPFKDRVAVVGPQIIDVNAMESPQKYLRLGKFPCFSRVETYNDRDDVSVVITSGSLINLDVLDSCGMFMETLFIDYVDTEYCLRLLRQGFRIGVSHNAKLYHSLGDKEVHSMVGLKFIPTNHSALRRYYMARNSIFMIKNYGLKFPSWLCYDIVASTYNFFRIAFCESDRLKKTFYSLKGYCHGFRGVTGRLPD